MGLIHQRKRSIMRRRHAQAAAAAAIVAMVLSVTGPVSAGTHQDHDRFGAHVSHHARTVGFDGEQNPGMHHGAAGWEQHGHDGAHMHSAAGRPQR